MHVPEVGSIFVWSLAVMLTGNPVLGRHLFLCNSSSAKVAIHSPSFEGTVSHITTWPLPKSISINTIPWKSETSRTSQGCQCPWSGEAFPSLTFWSVHQDMVSFDSPKGVKNAPKWFPGERHLHLAIRKLKCSACKCHSKSSLEPKTYSPPHWWGKCYLFEVSISHLKLTGTMTRRAVCELDPNKVQQITQFASCTSSFKLLWFNMSLAFPSPAATARASLPQRLPSHGSSPSLPLSPHPSSPGHYQGVLRHPATQAAQDVFKLLKPFPSCCAQAILQSTCIWGNGWAQSRVWWVDLAWTPGAHKAALSLCSSAGWGQGGENKTEKISWVKIKAV